MNRAPHSMPRPGCSARANAALLGVAASLGVSVSHAAESSNFTLIWDAPASCPSTESVRSAVVQLLRAARPVRPVRVHARVSREPELYRVRLVTHRDGARGVRDLEAPTCTALVDAVTIIVALAIDPQLLSRGADPDAATALPATGATAAESDGADSGGAHETPETAPSGATALGDDTEVAPTGPRAAPAPRRAVAGELGDEGSDVATIAFRDRGLQVVAALAGSVESGALPGFGFGITARGGVRRRRFRAELAVTRWLARDAFSAEAGEGASVAASALAGWGCFRAVPGHTAPLPGLRSELPPDDEPAIEGGACLGVEAGQMTAQSFGVTDRGSGSSGFASLGGALRLGATAAEWISLDVRVEGLALLHRPRFELEDEAVHRPDSWSMRASMGAEVYFP